MVTIIDDLPVWGEPDPASVAQIKRCVDEHAAGGALMADHHLSNALLTSKRPGLTYVDDIRTFVPGV